MVLSKQADVALEIKKTGEYYVPGRRIGSGIGRLFQTTSNEPARSANDHGKLPPDYLRETRISNLKFAKETNLKFTLMLTEKCSFQNFEQDIFRYLEKRAAVSPVIGWYLIRTAFRVACFVAAIIRRFNAFFRPPLI